MIAPEPRRRLSDDHQIQMPRPVACGCRRRKSSFLHAVDVGYSLISRRLQHLIKITGDVDVSSYRTGLRDDCRADTAEAMSPGGREIDANAQDFFQVHLRPAEIEQRRLGKRIHQNVDVAVLAIVAAQSRAEQRGFLAATADAARLAPASRCPSSATDGFTTGASLLIRTTRSACATQASRLRPSGVDHETIAQPGFRSARDDLLPARQAAAPGRRRSVVSTRRRCSPLRRNTGPPTPRRGVPRAQRHRAPGVAR